MTEIPAGAKKPTDRKSAKADDGPLEVVVRGATITVPRDALDDFELLDDMSQLENGNPSRMPSLLRRLVGEQWKDVLDLARDKDTGRVSIEAGALLVQEIMEGINPNS